MILEQCSVFWIYKINTTQKKTKNGNGGKLMTVFDSFHFCAEQYLTCTGFLLNEYLQHDLKCWCNI